MVISYIIIKIITIINDVLIIKEVVFEYIIINLGWYHSFWYAWYS